MESETPKQNIADAVFEALLCDVRSGDHPADSSEMTAKEWDKLESDINEAFEGTR
jgi:hypothetical protein